MFICEEISIIFLICQKLGTVGPVQQRIELPLPYSTFICTFESKKVCKGIEKLQKFEFLENEKNF